MTDNGWGPWKLDLGRFGLDRAPDSSDSYPIDLLSCQDSDEVLDYICQVARQRWADDVTLAGLIRALNDVLDPQATLCSVGEPKRQSDKQLRERITAAAGGNSRAT
ncbi:MAG: hypothetical protein WAN20_25065 [Pseudonocardiaceae bacterium]